MSIVLDKYYRCNFYRTKTDFILLKAASRRRGRYPEWHTAREYLYKISNIAQSGKISL